MWESKNKRERKYVRSKRDPNKKYKKYRIK